MRTGGSATGTPEDRLLELDLLEETITLILDELENLSAVAAEVFFLKSEGLQNKEVAERLGISPARVSQIINKNLSSLEQVLRLQAMQRTFDEDTGKHLVPFGTGEDGNGRPIKDTEALATFGNLGEVEEGSENTGFKWTGGFSIDLYEWNRPRRVERDSKDCGETGAPYARGKEAI